ncbi:hypothetical protein DSECCO2_65830 [anaerobic digester metagenome]
MRIITIFALSTLIGIAACTHPKQEETTSNNGYDSLLAQKLGADDYGMKLYVFATLKTGPTVITDSAQRAALMQGHLSNINRLANEGKLVIAGPYINGGENRGLFIFNVETIEEAKALTETDPAVKAGVFRVELTQWYGSAALMEVNTLHAKLERKSTLN